MSLLTIRRPAALAAALLLALACRTERVTAREDDPNLRGSAELSGDMERDRAEVVRLESEAKALARTEGCAAASGCEAAPVGAVAVRDTLGAAGEGQQEE